MYVLCKSGAAVFRCFESMNRAPSLPRFVPVEWGVFQKTHYSSFIFAPVGPVLVFWEVRYIALIGMIPNVGEELRQKRRNRCVIFVFRFAKSGNSGRIGGLYRLDCKILAIEWGPNDGARVLYDRL